MNTILEGGARITSMRGRINALKKGKQITLNASEYAISFIRATAGNLTADTGKKFNVKFLKEENTIIVTRII